MYTKCSLMISPYTLYCGLCVFERARRCGTRSYRVARFPPVYLSLDVPARWGRARLFCPLVAGLVIRGALYGLPWREAARPASVGIYGR